jgi:hypothetical protein
MSIVLVGSTSGSITLQEPAIAGTTTINLPATSGTVVLQNGSNDLLMNSGYGSNAVAYGCRAWVNFNGTGTVAIRGSGNVSSITDNGVGDYTVNFTTAMPDASYSKNISSSGSGTSGATYYILTDCTGSGTAVAPTTTQSRFTVQLFGVGAADTEYVYFSVFR